MTDTTISDRVLNAIAVIRAANQITGDDFNALVADDPNELRYQLEGVAVLARTFAGMIATICNDTHGHRTQDLTADDVLNQVTAAEIFLLRGSK